MSDEDVRKRVERRMEESEEIQKRSAAAIEVLPLEALRELARLYVEEVGYLGDHAPGEREHVQPFACSGNTYHYCSFTTQHDPGCPAVGGDGKLQNGYENASPCAPDCGETDAEPWCPCSGFNCATCEIVDKLLGLLAAHGA